MLQTLLDPAVIGSHPRNPRRAVGDVTVRVLRTRETWFGSPVASIPTPPQDGALSR